MEHMAFYEAAAQIIPVLGLAIVIQQRRAGARTASSEPIPFATYSLLLLAIGEALALKVIYRGYEKHGDLAWVGATLVAAGFAIILPSFGDLARTFARGVRRERFAWVLMVVLGTVVPVALFAYVLVSY
jgi:hypothetical protein